jgi:hypothetical protein
VTDPTIPPSPCPCAMVVHPWVIFNPPNQPTIDYRVGDYAAFRDALLRALPGETELTQTVSGQVIQIWRPGAEGDLAVQMMEWWAYLSDVLTFYNQRVAIQAYLGVADLPESVNRLIQLLGYRPRPGIGASGTLAALLNTAKPVTLPQGFQVQSQAGPGQQPQIFELATRAVLEKPDLVSARPVPLTAPLLSPDGKTVWLAGKIGGIKPGERLLLVNGDAVTGGAITAFAWPTVQAAQPQNNPYGDPVTAITFTAAVQGKGISPEAQAARFALLRSGQSARPWSTRPTGWSTPVISDGGIDLASIARDLSPGSLALFEVIGTPTDQSVVTTLVTIKAYSEAVWYANGNGLAPPDGPNPPIPIPILHTHLDFTPSLTSAWDDEASLVTLRFGWSSVGQLVPVLSASQAAFAGAPAMLTTTAAFPIGVDLPILLQDAQGGGASAVGTVGTGDAAATTMTIGSIAAMPAGGLGPTIDVLFDLLTLSRGKTVANEVLGSGNAAVAGQDFVLQKSPVTYFIDPASLSGDGFSSTVQVWVNQLRWTEVRTFFRQPSDATVFVTHEDEQGKTHVRFGDGINGARVPTGVNNVVATYRTGSGAAAPLPGTLTNILQPQPGLKSVLNPIAPTGGADPDPPSRVRTLAPRSVLTFGRAISLDDYQAIAAGTPGVIQAAAEYRFDPLAQRPGVTVWVSGDAGAVASVHAAIAAEADPNRPVAVLMATGLDTMISLTYVRDARYLDEIVNGALHAALLDPDSGLFGINTVGIGEAFYDSQIYAACLTVPGIVAVQDLSVQVGNRLTPLLSARPIRRGRQPLGVAAPCSGERHDPGIGNYILVPDDGNHLQLTGIQAS